MRTEEIGTFSDVLFLLEGRGFTKQDAQALVLQVFGWGVASAFDRMRPTRPLPPDLPQEVHQALSLCLETEAAAPKPTKPKREPAKGLHRIPADFAIDDDMRCFAVERAFPPRAIEAMWTKFFNHYRANGQTAVDWKAKWRTWVMKTVEFNTRDGRTPGGLDNTGGGFL